MSVEKTCEYCNGTGLIEGESCTYCGGDGLAPLASCRLEQTVNYVWANYAILVDVLDKVNDIKEVVDEIKEVVDGL